MEGQTWDMWKVPYGVIWKHKETRSEASLFGQ